MSVRFVQLMSLALVVALAPVLSAQDEGRGRGQRGGQGGGQRGGGGFGGGGFGGGGFGGPGGGFEMPAALELMGLLRMEEVREEIDLSTEVYEALQKTQPDFRSMRDASPEERAEKMKEFGAQAADAMDEVLEPGQQTRLMGLLVQQRGNSAVTNEMIAEKIGLDADGIKKVKEAVQAAGEEVRKSGESMRDEMREIFTSGDREKMGEMREKMQAMMEKAREAGDAAIVKVLTADQKSELEKLKGEKFEFPEQQFGGRGAGGPQGGGRGAGGAGGRPDRGGDRAN